MVTNENSNNYTCLLPKVSQFLEPFMTLLTKLRWKRHVFERNLTSIKDSFLIFLVSLSPSALCYFINGARL